MKKSFKKIKQETQQTASNKCLPSDYQAKNAWVETP